MVLMLFNMRFNNGCALIVEAHGHFSLFVHFSDLKYCVQKSGGRFV